MRIAALLKAHGYNISYIDFLNRHHPKIKKFTRDDGFGCGKFYKWQIQKPEQIKNVPRSYFIYGLPEELVNEEIKNVFKPDIIFMTSGMTYWYPGLEYTSRVLKKVFPDAPVVLGGIYATLLPKHAKSLEGIDYVVQGSDLESVCSQLSKILNKNFQLPEYYIYPEYGLLSDTSSLVMETSKGCPFNCSYCGSKQLNKSFLQREPLDVLKEIGFYWQAYRVKDIAFYDDALLVSSEGHMVPILDGVCKMNLPINFHTPNGLHAKLVTKELAEKLKKANFKTIRLSLETVNPQRQIETGGKVANEDFEDAVNNLKSVGYSGKDIGVYLMLGMPRQKEDEVRNGIEFIHKLGVSIILASYALVPNTADEKMLLGEGIIEKGLDPLWHNNTIFPLKEGNFSVENIKKLRRYAASLNKKII